MAYRYLTGMIIASACFYIPALLGFFTPMFWLHFILGIPTLLADSLMSLAAWWADGISLSDYLYSSTNYLDVFPKGWPDAL